jgi:hypothetical protein
LRDVHRFISFGRIYKKGFPVIILENSHIPGLLAIWPQATKVPVWTRRLIANCESACAYP